MPGNALGPEARPCGRRPVEDVENVLDAERYAVQRAAPRAATNLELGLACRSTSLVGHHPYVAVQLCVEALDAIEIGVGELDGRHSPFAQQRCDLHDDRAFRRLDLRLVRRRDLRCHREREGAVRRRLQRRDDLLGRLTGRQLDERHRLAGLLGRDGAGQGDLSPVLDDRRRRCQRHDGRGWRCTLDDDRTPQRRMQRVVVAEGAATGKRVRVRLAGIENRGRELAAVRDHLVGLRVGVPPGDGVAGIDVDRARHEAGLHDLDRCGRGRCRARRCGENERQRRDRPQ